MVVTKAARKLTQLSSQNAAKVSATEPLATEPVLVVGAGLAGLACAIELERLGHRVILIEASDGVGGRVRTDITAEGYRLDRGFQVLLPAYSEARSLFDYRALNLREFEAGARIRTPDGTFVLADPLANPMQLFNALRSPVGTFADKLRVAKLRASLKFKSDDRLIADGKRASTLEHFKALGFSTNFIEDFWRPFLSGVFLESDLSTESGYALFLMKMFAARRVAVPALGMGELAKQLSSRLRQTELRLNSRAVFVTARTVELASGETVRGSAVICAVEPRELQHLSRDRISIVKGHRVRTHYFVRDHSPIDGAWLWLKSSRVPGTINHIAVMTQVAPEYAPHGKQLLCLNEILTDDARSEAVSVDAASDPAKQLALEIESLIEQAERLLGIDATWQFRNWRHLRTYDLNYAQPAFTRGQRHDFRMRGTVRLDDGVWYCGDFFRRHRYKVHF